MAGPHKQHFPPNKFILNVVLFFKKPILYVLLRIIPEHFNQRWEKQFRTKNVIPLCFVVVVVEQSWVHEIIDGLKQTTLQWYITPTFSPHSWTVSHSYNCQ